MQQTFQTPQLAMPGAGIPAVEQWVARYLVLPLYQLRYGNWIAARQFYENSLLAPENLAADWPDATTEQPILIKRLVGLEDSSRYWSPAQVIMHLAIVDGAVAAILPQLLAGQNEFMKVSTAAVKPPVVTMAQALAALNAAKNQVRQAAAQPINSSTVLSHPWFGPLTAKQWLVMAGMHHGIHYQQLLAMQRQLGKV